MQKVSVHLSNSTMVHVNHEAKRQGISLSGAVRRILEARTLVSDGRPFKGGAIVSGAALAERHTQWFQATQSEAKP